MVNYLRNDLRTVLGPRREKGVCVDPKEYDLRKVWLDGHRIEFWKTPPKRESQ